MDWDGFVDLGKGTWDDPCVSLKLSIVMEVIGETR